MRTVDSDLQNFATDHAGWFPKGSNSCEALCQLYPDYTDYGIELAGLSGNIRAVTNALQNRLSIEGLTSWVYVPGLRADDDPRLAILWESKTGLKSNGKRAHNDARPVLLLSRDITNVPSADWENFLKHQEQLRKAVQANREAANAPLPDAH
jgi:hypothetical protein